MSNSLWERFDNIVKPEEVEEAKVSFTPVDEGVYKMILEEITPSESKQGLPMLKGKFRIVENNRVVFYNQLLQNLNYPDMTAVNIAEAVSFVSGLLEEEIEFTGLADFADLITTIPIGTEHTIQVSYGKNDTEKKYTKLKVVKDLDEVNEEYFSPTEDDIPF